MNHNFSTCTVYYRSSFVPIDLCPGKKKKLGLLHCIKFGLQDVKIQICHSFQVLLFYNPQFILKNWSDIWEKTNKLSIKPSKQQSSTVVTEQIHCNCYQAVKPTLVCNFAVIGECRFTKWSNSYASPVAITLCNTSCKTRDYLSVSCHLRQKYY